jgi:hypothetical protein
VAYGSKAQQAFGQGDSFEIPLPVKRQEPAMPQEKGFFGRLKDQILNLVTEESATERPIGIAQLTQKTFQPHQAVADTSFFRSGQTMQDYRFNRLVDPNKP